MPDVILRVEGVSKKFGGLLAVDSLSFEVQRAEIHALIGPNGSGKTTLFNLVTGLLPIDAGKVFLEGVAVTNNPAHRIARLGVSRTFQAPVLFVTMSVLDNVIVGCQCRDPYSLGRAVLDRARGDALRGRAEEALRFVGLDVNLAEQAVNLPYGAQRLLEIARALATGPKLLLLDEPAAGMNPEETNALAALIRRVRDELAITVLLIEHNMNMVMNLAESITCIDHGRRIANGTPVEVARNPKVIEAYLGEDRPRTRRAWRAGRPNRPPEGAPTNA